MSYMGDWHQVPLTLLEATMTLLVLAVAAIIGGAIFIEAATGLPARIAVEQWLR